MTFTFPVLFAIFLFRYMQVKLSSDFTHSLPIKREQLYNQHILFGLLGLITPVLITSVSLLILGQFLPYNELLSFSSVFNWTMFSLLFAVFVFLAGVFVGMLSGMSILQAALTYILFVFPVGITMLFYSNLEFYLFGFSATYYINQKFENIIPFIRISQLEQNPLTTIEIVVYLLLSASFYLCALLAYKKRPTETATQAIAFAALRPVFKYGVTFCTMLVGGLYFGSVQGGMGWTIFGYITAALLGYYLATMILEKTWRVLAKWKGYLGFLIVVTILGVSFQLDAFGFEKRIPNIEEIQGVHFGDSIYQILDQDRFYHYYDGERMEEYIEPKYHYNQSGTIKSILSLHEQIIKEKNQLKKTASQTDSVAFRYHLKNGKELVRHYQIPMHAYQKHYREIVESPEYKQNQFPILEVDDITSLKRITINSYRTGQQVRIIDPQELAEFHQLLKADISNQTTEEMLDELYWWSQIEYEFEQNKYLHLTWKKSYTQIEDWLDKKDLLSQARVTAADLSHAYIIKNDPNRNMYDFIYENRLEDTLDEREDVIKISDPAELQELLNQSGGNHTDDYIIGFYLSSNSYPEFESISREHLPNSIINKLP
ncbi:hypothetical protein JCM9157_3659 [Halalkalibacter akibai JCM 9157]|uniref:DUF6449 domain-containing protein n=2 Tax=Halalkalibacter akibai TaxID=1411 RepID=W4QWH5_HALA3|nr:hypothetical protein JCM9157_3659 [Halalkalibacter akibai JCM 9157]